MEIYPVQNKSWSTVIWKLNHNKMKIYPIQNEGQSTTKWKLSHEKIKMYPIQNESLSDHYKIKMYPIQNQMSTETKFTQYKTKCDRIQNEPTTMYFYSNRVPWTLLHSFPKKGENHFNNSNSTSFLYFQSLFSPSLSMNSSFQNKRPIYREKIVRKKLDSFPPPTDDSVSRNEVSSVAIFLVAGCSCNRRPIQIYCTWYFSVTPSSPSRCCCAWYSAAR